ncbi:hypothetical protein PF005_g2297 [Phytophthora fragariae]|uniref:HTH CENPB-type domain-containing protein n=1 Tax=Phytophthora fragariae TaxID=53985 RepID=A0A6A3ZG24_9STRA|nr:hypothetical protein PF005_g2297 [Phytophthora fragariae]
MNMEDMIYDLVIDKRLRKEKVTREWIADQALVCHASPHADDNAPPPFAASQHWVSNFMTRRETNCSFNGILCGEVNAWKESGGGDVQYTWGVLLFSDFTHPLTQQGLVF